jgi:hypothetical protein
LAKNRYLLAPTTTDALIGTFNGATQAAKFTLLQPFMIVNGTTATLASLTAGTGHTTLTIGNIDVQNTPGDEGTAPTIPQTAALP